MIGGRVAKSLNLCTMYYKLIYTLSAVLRFCPRWFVSELLRRYCPSCWASAWPKSVYIETIEDILLSR